MTVSNSTDRISLYGLPLGTLLIYALSGMSIAQTSAIDYYTSGNAKDKKGDIDGAIADYTRALKLDPKNPLIYRNRGYLKHKKGDLDGAIEDYNSALELDPRSEWSFHNRGRAKYSKDDFEGAIKDYNRALELDPRNALATKIAVMPRLERAILLGL
jgi:tetratricopeptide (TPR) repeat protein